MNKDEEDLLKAITILKQQVNELKRVLLQTEVILKSIPKFNIKAA